MRRHRAGDHDRERDHDHAHAPDRENVSGFATDPAPGVFPLTS